MSKLTWLGACVVGKTIEKADYLAHELVVLYFTDGTTLQIEQPMQSGSLSLWYLANDIARKVEADDEGE